MDTDPIIERSVPLPFGYVITARARPSSVKRTVIHLLPWALYVMLPQGRAAKIAHAVARRTSPLVKQKMR